jgi:hypothetical protein
MKKTSEGAGNDLLIIDPVTYTLTTTINSVSGSYPFTNGPNGTVRSITYYDGDGTIGSDRFFVQYVDGSMYSYDANAPYTETLFISAAPAAQPNIYYTKLFNKLLWIKGTSVTIYNPEDSTDTYGVVTLSGNNASRPTELTDFNQIVFHRYTDTDNVIFVGLDTDNAVECEDGLVEMFISNSGPYKWDSVNSEWDSMATIALALDTPTVGEFTVTSTLHPDVISACLMISTDGGITYETYSDTSYTLYANIADWAAGRVYTTPVGAFSIKLKINTSTDCVIESDVITSP